MEDLKGVTRIYIMKNNIGSKILGEYVRIRGVCSIFSRTSSINNSRSIPFLKRRKALCRESNSSFYGQLSNKLYEEK